MVFLKILKVGNNIFVKNFKKLGSYEKNPKTYHIIAVILAYHIYIYLNKIGSYKKLFNIVIWLT